MSPSRGGRRGTVPAHAYIVGVESPRRRPLQLSIRGRTVASAARLSGGDRPGGEGAVSARPSGGRAPAGPKGGAQQPSIGCPPARPIVKTLRLTLCHIPITNCVSSGPEIYHGSKPA